MDLLLAEVRDLETEHRDSVRRDVARLRQLLHADFREVGRSGRIYDRATVIRFLAEQESSPSVLADEFALLCPAPGVALLTYRSASRANDGSLQGHALRSSVWLQVGGQWQLRYHQGTAAARPW